MLGHINVVFLWYKLNLISLFNYILFMSYKLIDVTVVIISIKYNQNFKKYVIKK